MLTQLYYALGSDCPVAASHSLTVLSSLAEARVLPSGLNAIGHDRLRMPPENGSFEDTAALMLNMELVISLDTATAHLAGGLGVPVWVSLSAIGEWRWLLKRPDSPWYPTMRLPPAKTGTLASCLPPHGR